METWVELFQDSEAMATRLATWGPPSSAAGAEASFGGRVRADLAEEGEVEALRLEHYPGMTEAAMQGLAQAALSRFGLERIALLHRVGELAMGELIVAISVASSHRQASLEALTFVMDRLKEEVPLWKQVRVAGAWHWVDPKASDAAAAEAWCAQRP